MPKSLPSAATIVALLVTLAIATQTSFAASAPDTRAPKRVRLVDVSAADRTSVTVGWSPSRDNVGVAGYGVYLDGSNRGSTTERSFVFQQLVCGTGYLVGVDAFDAAGNRSSRNSTSVATDPCRDVSAPSAPVGVQQLATSETSAVFGWLASTDDVGVVEYGLYVSGLQTGNVSQATATLSNLACDTTYSLGIDAADAAGNRSAKTPVFFKTASCVDRTAPSAPANLRVGSASQTSVLVRWDSASDNVGVTNYRVYRNGTEIGEGPGAAGGFANEWNDSGRTCGSTYQYAVEAVDAAGNVGPRTTLSTATSACAGTPTPPPTAPGPPPIAPTTPPPTTPAPPPASPPAAPTPPTTPPPTAPAAPPAGGDTTAPSAPANLRVGSASQTSVLVRWDSASDNVGVTNYRVYRDGTKLGEGPGVHGGFANEWNDSGRTCGSTYQYAVEAVDAAGNVGPRTTLSTATSACAGTPTPPPTTPPPTTPPPTTPPPTTPPPTTPPPAGDTTAPSAPANLRVGSASQTSVLVRWDSASDNVGVTNYRVYRDGTKLGEGPGVHGGFANEWNDSGRTCGSTYQYAVEAVDAAGNVGPRTTLSTATSACAGTPTPPPTTPPPPPPPPAPPADTTAPTVPGNVIASTRTATSIALTWAGSTDNVGVTGYGLYNGGTRVATTAGTTGIVSGLACNTNYTLAVDAADAAGNRSGQAVVMVSTTACPDTQAPSTPAGLTASNVTQTALTISWGAATDNVGVTGYDVYRGGTKVGYATGLSTSLTGLTCGTSYVLAVAARDAAGNQSSQAQLTRSTVACAAPPPPPPAGDTTPPSATPNVRVGSATQTSVLVRWDSATDNVGVVNYRVYRNGTKIGEGPGAAGGFANEWNDSGRTCGSTYQYAVEAVDAAGNTGARTTASLATAACGGGPPPAPPSSPPPSSPPTGGTLTPAQFESQTTSAGARVENCSVSGSGTISIRGANVTVRNCTFTGVIVDIDPSADGLDLLDSRFVRAGFNVWGADDVLIQGNDLDGGGAVSSNQLWDMPAHDMPERFVIRSNTFRNYYKSGSHSEAVFVGYSSNGLIENNTFTNNGNTSHVFFSYFGTAASQGASASQTYARNMCVRGNTFNQTAGAYFDVNFRSEIPSNANIKIQRDATNTDPEFYGDC